MMALELEDRARARGARDLRDHRRLRLDVRRLSPRADGSRRRADREVHARRDRQVGPRAGRDRLHQLSRHVDAAERRDRIALHAPGVRHARRAHSGVVDEVDDRPSAGRERSGGRGRHRAGAVARLPAADDQPDRVPIRDCDLDFIPNAGPRRVAGGGALQLPWIRIEEQRARARPIHPRAIARRAEMDDVAIAGAGPAGALAAAILARAGLRVQRVRSRALSTSQALRRHAESRRARGASPSRRRRRRSSRTAIRSTACC